MQRLVHFDRFKQDVLFISPDVSCDIYKDFLRKKGSVAVQVHSDYAEAYCPSTNCETCIFHYYDNGEGCNKHAFNIFKRLSNRISNVKELI